MPSVGNTIGLALAFLGVGMELIRPALYRWQIQIPRWLDTLLGSGGLLLIAIGVYLFWGFARSTVRIQLPISIVSSETTTETASTPWPDAFIFAVIIAGILWAAVRLPPRLVNQTNPSYFELGFMVGHLKYKDAAEPSKLDNLKIRCEQLGLSYAAAKLSRVLDAIEMDRFEAEETGLYERGSFANSETVFDREMADIEKVITKEFEQQRKR